MKKSRTLAALALLAMTAVLTPAHAVTLFTVDFEKAWDYGTSIDAYYGGGAASDGSSGANLGVTFQNVLGLSNDAPNFVFYSGAPSPLGVAFAQVGNPGDKATMTMASSVSAFTLYYASPSDVAGAIKAYDGVNGTGNLLGTLNLVANSSSYDHFTKVSFAVAGNVRSLDFTGGAGVVALDNIAAVPEPATMLMLAMGTAVLLARRRH